MALRDQPYLPLYVQDVLTDERLGECSAQAHGVYFLLLCLLHKNDPYGQVLLKQKFKPEDDVLLEQKFQQIIKQNATIARLLKQNSSNLPEQILKRCFNFACQLERKFPFTLEVVFESVLELLFFGVLQLKDEALIQKRMVRDDYISQKRAESGSKGGKFAQAKIKANTLAKIKANTEIEIENHIYGFEEKKMESPKKPEVEAKILDDPLTFEQLKMTHRTLTAEEIRMGWEHCWAHHSVGPEAPTEVWAWQKKLTSWLANMERDKAKGTKKSNGNGNGKKRESTGELWQTWEGQPDDGKAN